jgi:hypothetical protein
VNNIKNKKLKNKNNKEGSGSGKSTYLIVIFILIVGIIATAFIINSFTQTNTPLGFRVLDLSTGGSSVTLEQEPRENVIEVWDQSVTEVARGVIIFNSRYEEGDLLLNVFIASISLNTDTDFILNGNSGKILTISNFTNYLTNSIWNGFKLSYDVTYNDYELFINNVSVLKGKFDVHADLIDGFEIVTSVHGALLLYIDVVSME